jgi:hypothetical protein
MAFEFRDILPAVGAVIGFGFGGPGGAALGSGIGSLARGDEMSEAAKNAALGYAGGTGVKYLGQTTAGGDFLSKIPFAGEFLTGGTTKTLGDLLPVFAKTNSADNLAKLTQSDQYQQLKNAYDTADDAIVKAGLEKKMENLVANVLDPQDTNLLDPNSLLKLGRFTLGFGSILDKDSQGGPSYQDFQVTTDTVVPGFDQPTPIRKVTEFAANGGLMSLAQGGFPRKNGKITGPGTETSDDIPAMLSDGEFVVNARTVRGLGQAMGGKGNEDARERGASFLYSIQDKYGGKA